jgi:hypothetical protein
VRVANGSDEEGVLVFTDEQRLVAVLTRLSDHYEGVIGDWYLEAGFGPLDGPNHPTFADLDAAQEWIGKRLTGRCASGSSDSPPHTPPPPPLA